MRLDEATGYLEPKDKRGFSAEMRKTFVDRFRVCSNMTAISRSINIDIQSVYDAIAVDPKFRKDIIACNTPDSNGIDKRSKKLNDELVKLAASEKSQVISDLQARRAKYLGLS